MSSDDVFRLPTAYFGRAHRLDAGYFGEAAQLRGASFGSASRIGGAVLPVDDEPPPVTYAPDFAGIQRLQLRPKDLLGTLALGDPIDALPCYGDMVVGSFTAAASARPALQDDGTGRVGALFDGVTDMPALDGVSLDWRTTGVTVCALMRPTWTSGVRGVFLANAGGDLTTQHVVESNVSTYSGGTLHNMTVAANRNTTLGFAVSGNVFPIGGLSSYVGIFGLTDSGVYDDGAVVSASGADLRPDTVVDRLRIAGFGLGKFQGTLFDLVVYGGTLDAAQRESVRDYFRDEWNSGAPI